MKNYVHHSEYFYGNKISEYGLANGYVDYSTLAKAFGCVMLNGVEKLFHSTINNEFVEPEQVNGMLDYSEQIDELREQIDELFDLITDESTTEEDEQTNAKIKELEECIEELEEEQDNIPDIYQWFIISDYGKQILEECTNEIVYYIPVLDCYVWGITHFGTSWDYVLTDIKIELEGK